MPVEHASSRSAARPRDAGKVVRYHDYIDDKIESTRRAVKAVDLATAFVELGVAALLFLLLVVVIEHWLVPGGFPVAVRTVLFAALLAGSGYFAFRRLWPLCARAINPVYAAHTIEQGSPTLKNGLINLLLFRQRRSEIPDAVYHTLEEQAAHGLTRAAVDTSVDRSELIRLGYVLLAIVAVGALYKVLSPKDPFVAIERVLMPWAHIVPASRVTISGIEPGTVTVSRGEFVDVSADIRGMREGERAALRFSTDDGQIVSREIPLKSSPEGWRFTCRLTEDSASSAATAGVTRNLTYRLEAGDARSLDYPVTVVPAASILVERVDYDYPAYTQYVDHSVDGLGDIRAIEGTRITVHARANGAIREAHVDFDADGRQDLKMTAAELQARASFDLALRDDRRTPQHASYVLRFSNDEGRSNRDPVKHSIQVDPDLRPEAEIRTPQEPLRDVRLDERVAIEVAANDPDFALGAVRLRGQLVGRDILNEPLLQGEHRGRFNGRHVLTPHSLGLKPGDILEYWVEADDNRTPRPNTVATEHKSLRVVSPESNKTPREKGKQNEREQQQREDDANDSQGENGSGKSASGESNPGEPTPDKSASGESASADGEPGKRNDQKPSNGQQQNQPGGGPGDKSSDRNDGSDNGQAGTGDPSRDPAQQPNQGQSTGQGQQSGTGSEGGEPSPAEKPFRDAQSGAKPSGQPTGDKERPGQDRQSPVSSEGDNDAEAFDRIQKHLHDKGELQREQTGGEKRNDGDSENGKGPGAETRDDDLNQQGGAKPDQPPEDKSPGGEQASSKGSPGSGDETKPQGAPNSRPNMKPTEKPQQPSSPTEKSNQQEPAAGANSKRESDSHGEQGGDKAGGGEEGGGQKAPRDGTGSAGANQSADRGAGHSGEKGKGENSTDAGNTAKSRESTGANDGTTNGAGSERRDGTGDKLGGQSDNAQNRPASRDMQRTAQQPSTDEKGEKSNGPETETHQDQGTDTPGDKPGESASSETNARDQSAAPPPDATKPTNPQNGDTNNQPSPAGASGSNGEPGRAVNPQPSITGEAPEADAANLEYARKQTDLVLDKLADQLKRQRVDDGLLKDLGWSAADLKKFVERWQQRKAAAQKDDATGETARRELDDALRSLGLRRGELQQSSLEKDALRNLREGYRGPVPTEYKDRLRAYNQGVSRARPSGE